MSNVRALAAAALTAAVLAAPRAAAGQYLGPSPYVSFADSPFGALTGWSYFHLETFEDHLLNTPGVTGSAGGVTSVVFGPSIHDSVDEDDGAIDGSGLQGDDWFSPSGGAGVTWAFSAAVLGTLPTHVGIVWTDGVNPISFEAFDAMGGSLGVLGPFSHADPSFTGGTAEDRFYGVVNAGGISAIRLSSGAGGGIEMDHLQYGALTAIPEPATVALVGGGLLVLAAAARRRR